MKAEEKIHKVVHSIKNGKPPQEGLGIVYHLAGLFGQRLYFFWKTQTYTDKIKINSQKCIGCGLCEKLCPMRNLAVKMEVLYQEINVQCAIAALVNVQNRQSHYWVKKLLNKMI